LNRSPLAGFVPLGDTIASDRVHCRPFPKPQSAPLRPPVYLPLGKDEALSHSVWPEYNHQLSLRLSGCAFGGGGSKEYGLGIHKFAAVQEPAELLSPRESAHQYGRTHRTKSGSHLQNRHVCWLSVPFLVRRKGGRVSGIHGFPGRAPKRTSVNCISQTQSQSARIRRSFDQRGPNLHPALTWFGLGAALRQPKVMTQLTPAFACQQSPLRGTATPDAMLVSINSKVSISVQTRLNTATCANRMRLECAKTLLRQNHLKSDAANSFSTFGVSSASNCDSALFDGAVLVGSFRFLTCLGQA
jgi:hypothetical protein